MQFIQINSKDCDFIANVIREEIVALTNNYHNAIEEGNKRTKYVLDLVDIIGLKDDDIMKEKEELQKTQRNAMVMLKRNYNELLEKYNKCLEILMLGSNP